MTNDNDVLLLLSSQNNGTYGVYIDSKGYKTLTPQTSNYTAKYQTPYVYNISSQSGLLYDKNPKKVKFPNCIKASGWADDSRYGRGAFESAFAVCTSLTSVSFPSLTTASGGSGSEDSYGAFESAFIDCTSLTSVSFPALTTATGGSGGSYKDHGAFYRAFYRCTSLTSVSFPALTTVTGGSGGAGGAGSQGAFEEAFRECTSLTSVSFPSLTTATSGSGGSLRSHGAFDQAFRECTSLTSVSFPALTTVIANTDSSSATFYYAFYKCSPSLKVHFKKSMKGTAGLDYKTMSLTSADQVVFDLD